MTGLIFIGDELASAHWEDRMADSVLELKVDKVEKETPKAWLLVVNGSEVWMPKSQTRGPVQEGGEQVIKVTEWIAEKKGLFVPDGDPDAPQKVPSEPFDDGIPF